MKVVVLVFAAAFVIPIARISQLPRGTKPSFEVASVKPHLSGDSYMDGTPGGRFIASGIPLRMLITEAYNVRDFQVIGGPGWMNTDGWDIEARPKAEDVGAPGAQDRGSVMLQSLLEDRFQLRAHRETRELPVYALTVAKGGPKLKISSGVPAGLPRMRMSRGSLETYETPLGGIVRFLSREFDRLLIDRTNLQGLYDISLKWTPEQRRPAADGGATAAPQPALPPDQPSIFTALQEQLGLRVESTKAPVEVLVIDSVQKPSDN
jgi:uncharacterized protein (TIGR03435 family)